MARQAKRRNVSVSEQLKRSEVNLVSARSAYNADSDSYSRNARGGGYAAQRGKRSRNRKIITGVLVTLLALLVAGAAAAFGFVAYLNGQLSQSNDGAINQDILKDVLVDRVKPEDPFWMLLVGTDFDEGDGIVRSDTIILTRVDPGSKTAAMVSIPRDTKVTIPGYGTAKINAAYAYGQMETEEGHSGPEYIINAVTDLTGAGIAGYAQVDFYGFMDVVDALGGVEVDVPMDIIGDTDAGGGDVYAGHQVLDGYHALTFVRSRQFDIGDFQRQANQRTFLQAMARQVLSADPVSIINTVTKICEMTATNMNVQDIAAIANSMRGMSESDIYTYSIPSSLDMIDGISYVVVDEFATRELIAALDAGTHPDYSDMSYQGEVPDSYKAKELSSATDKLTGPSNVDTAAYLVAVRNGYGIAGAATSVSDMLNIAGYQQGEIGNANSLVYKDTLIVYRSDSDREAADDIRARLGYGRVIPSLDRYSFEGNILVVVGGDFAG